MNGSPSECRARLGGRLSAERGDAECSARARTSTIGIARITRALPGHIARRGAGKRSAEALQRRGIVMCRIRLVALSLALLLLPLPALAQDGGGLSGLITAGGSPVPGVEIQLQTESCDCRNCRTRCGRCCPASAFTFSDANGNYSF